MLKQRVITASILFVLFLAALFGLPTLGWQVLVLAVVWQSAVEWSRLAGLNGRAATVYWLLTLAMMAGMVMLDYGLAQQQQTLLHLVWYVLAVLLWVFVVPAWLIAGWRPRNAWLMGVVGWIVLLPTGLAMLDLRASSPWLLLFVMTVVMMADISAYFAGKRFGKNKLAPAISPGKTWEGVIGAMIGVTVYVVAVYWASGFYKQYPMLPGVVVAGWWWVALAVIGDLFESAVKRQAGVKDSGALLPGHGGLLDRIDALTSTLPFAAIVLVLQRLE
ncbi:phosphatidate cytidylyltransferase [Sideroxydans lithotrophicus]|uniref:Phosphatidate cytidylyltransferase n=1 Tax=Sideroxydans lithotrophicus (strain ES-1) TaxID=580332 RepID=D5CSE3_SIDLE|nr:phosphatidate cytidylyltransferase [Sideroxydans lithotrophicus]ADE11879.1 phosphatidate cytidylyltransferase [Sideroxydans lithotrophicus ES-1]